MNVRFHFNHFDAVDHPLEDVELLWTFKASQFTTSMAELAMLLFWKTAYRVRSRVRVVNRPLNRSILDVYLGVRIPESGLRSQIARLRNDSQYQTAGAGIDVGYAPETPIPEWAVMSEWFKSAPQKRLHMQMYLKVTATTELKDKRVLEIGCGQGDGAAFLTQIKPFAKYVGVDLHPTQIELCATRFKSLAPKLVFSRGDAQQLPLQSGAFDVAINVESSHSYPMFETFVAEVFRVLAPNGVFCFADLRKVPPGESPGAQLRKQFERAGFVIDRQEDITGNAFRSLDELREILGGRLWDEFESLRALFKERALEYHFFLLRKPSRQPGHSPAPVDRASLSP